MENFKLHISNKPYVKIWNRSRQEIDKVLWEDIWQRTTTERRWMFGLNTLELSMLRVHARDDNEEG